MKQVHHWHIYLRELSHTQKTKTKKKTLTILSGTATVSKYGRFQYLWENVVPAFFARFVPYTNLNTSKRFSDASSLPVGFWETKTWDWAAPALRVSY